MNALKENFMHGLRSEPEGLAGHAADALGAATGVGVLVAGAVIAARRFNEDRSQVANLLVSVGLGARAVGATIKAGRSAQDLVAFARTGESRARSLGAPFER